MRQAPLGEVRESRWLLCAGKLHFSFSEIPLLQRGLMRPRHHPSPRRPGPLPPWRPPCSPHRPKPGQLSLSELKL